MRRPPSPLVVAVLLALGIGAAQAQNIYRWVDRDGSIHYSDLLPPADARNEEQKNLGDNVIQSDTLPYAVRNAVENFPVTLYSSRDCGEPCSAGRDLLTQRKVPFSESDVQTKADAEALKAATGRPQPLVPSLIVGRQSAVGFQEATWNALLDAAGYPKAAP
jgi:glutaredoxin